MQNLLRVWEGFDYYDHGVTVAHADASASSHNRAALQTLIWCITDPVTDPTPHNQEDDRLATCEASMSAAEQARLLALIPEVPAVVLDFDEAQAPTEVGVPLEVALRTNIYEQDIELAVSDASTLSLVSGAATLAGTTLRVDAGGAEETIVLRVAPESDQPVTISATSRPTQRSAISWNQPGPDDMCQVFATFSDRSLAEVPDATALSYRSAAPQLAATGVSDAVLTAAITALALVAAGAGFMLRRRHA